MPANRLRPGPVVPQHVEQVLPAVIVVEQRGVEAAAVQIDRIGPLAVDLRAGHQVVVEVAQRRAGSAADGRAAVALDVGVDEIEQAVGVGQAGRPDAARVGIAEHVQLARASQRPRQQPPVHEIARVMDLHAGVPLEGRRRDVVVVADAHDGRIGIEARQDRVADGSIAYGLRAGGAGSRTRSPQQRGAGQVEHGQADEERRVADAGDQAADQQREDQQPGVAKRPGHASDRGDLVALEQIGGHRDDRHRQGLVREAAQAEQRDGRVGALDHADKAHAHHQARAQREGPPSRVDEADAALLQRTAPGRRRKDTPGPPPETASRQTAQSASGRSAARWSGRAAPRRSACPTSGPRETAAARCPRSCAAGRCGRWTDAGRRRAGAAPDRRRYTRARHPRAADASRATGTARATAPTQTRPRPPVMTNAVCQL